MKSFLVLLALLGCASANPTTYLLDWPASTERHGLTGAELLHTLGLDDYLITEDGGMQVFASEMDLERLKQARIEPQVIDRGMPFRDRLNSSRHKQNGPPLGYLDRGGIQQFLRDIEAAFPTLAQIQDASQWGPPTHEGRYIDMIKISDNVQLDEDEPNVIIVAAHHAREVITPEIIMEIISRLTTEYTTNPLIRQIVDNNQIYLVPVVNVDGYVYLYEVDDFWRKNRKNGYGVDINRNYDLGWDGPAGGSTDPNSNAHRGDFPLSEEESTFLINLERERNAAKIIDFHSSGREVLPGYRASPISTEVDDYNWAVGTELSILAQYATRIPSADGEHQQQGIKEITTFGWLVETGTSFQPPYIQGLEEVQRVWPLALRFLEYAIPLSGHVRSSSGIALQASLSVPGVIGVGTPHQRQSEPRFGRYHLYLIDGIYQVTFSASGHLPETRLVAFVAGNPQVLDVVLQIA